MFLFPNKVTASAWPKLSQIFSAWPCKLYASETLPSCYQSLLLSARQPVCMDALKESLFYPIWQNNLWLHSKYYNVACLTQISLLYSLSSICSLLPIFFIKIQLIAGWRKGFTYVFFEWRWLKTIKWQQRKWWRAVGSRCECDQCDSVKDSTVFSETTPEAEKHIYIDVYLKKYETCFRFRLTDGWSTYTSRLTLAFY